MKRFLLALSFVVSFGIPSFANHITGGEMYYTLLSQSGNNYTYSVTLKLYRDCNAPFGSAPLDLTAAIAIFDRNTNQMVWNQSVTRNQIVILNLGSPDPCISNPPSVCYQVGYYQFTVTLPATPGGYIISYQRCCRIAGINNLIASNSVGTTYTAEIPGNILLASGPINNSARFVGRDTVIVCANNPFQYSFAASDEDGDSLVYSFCNAFLGGSIGAAAPDPPNPPPYSSVPYAFPFGATSPLGSDINLNSNTGLISGIAPAAGIYVVTVCVTEYRNNIPITTQRKDLQIKVGDCFVAAATLEPAYITCDGFTLSFSNLSNSPLINSYFWDWGVASQTNDTSNIPIPTFTFPDTGVYIIKLVTNRNQSCSDSTNAIVKVYPGFFPNFDFNGICINKPTIFTDRTNTNYGVVNSWSWDFGDAGTLADTSRIRNPSWTFNATGPKSVVLTVTNSKGCIDTAVRVVDIIDKPPIILPFRDTVICNIDSLNIPASGSGIFSWTPNSNILFANTSNPLVFPTTTTWYKVDLDDNGCKNKDSVRVRVVGNVTLNVRTDTAFCKGDGVQLGAVTDGLQFSWAPNLNLSNPNIINPVANPPVTTTYQLTASIGSCSATDDVTVFVVPYPFVDAGPDVTICFKTPVQLNGSVIASAFYWRPQGSLSNSTVLDPIARPGTTTKYLLLATDTLGCPKPGYDSVIVTVLPKVKAYAGRDTAIVAGQPLQLNASGGESYLWSPPFGLNNVTVADPIANLNGNIDSIRYKVYVRDAAGCLDSSTILVKVFKTNPQIFVPTGFTPNGDGRNDVLKPIAVGIERIEYFNVYNRWGQLVFSTTINGQGWDGKIGGKNQSTGTFVWLVKAVDYTGKPVFQKGTTTLIR
jgi:gliding motility-associated-like protein